MVKETTHKKKNTSTKGKRKSARRALDKVLGVKGGDYTSSSDEEVFTNNVDKNNSMETNTGQQMEDDKGTNKRHHSDTSVTTTPAKTKQAKGDTADDKTVSDSEITTEKTLKSLLKQVTKMSKIIEGMKEEELQNNMRMTTLNNKLVETQVELANMKTAQVVENSQLQGQVNDHEERLNRFENKIPEMKTKIDEMTIEFNNLKIKMESAVTQMGSKIGMNQTAINNIQKTMMEKNAAYDKFMDDTKKTLQTLEKARAEMMQNAGRNDNQTGRSGSGAVLSGIMKLKEIYQMHINTDPVEVVRNMLNLTEAIAFFDRIIILDKTKPRNRADKAIIYFGSIQRKKEATQRIRHGFMGLGAKGVGLRDLFPSEMMEEVVTLNKYGYDLKMAGKIERFRVINRNEKPILQGLLPNAKYFRDIAPPTYEENDDIMEMDNTGGESQNNNRQMETNTTENNGGQMNATWPNNTPLALPQRTPRNTGTKNKTNNNNMRPHQNEEADPGPGYMGGGTRGRMINRKTNNSGNSTPRTSPQRKKSPLHFAGGTTDRYWSNGAQQQQGKRTDGAWRTGGGWYAGQGGHGSDGRGNGSHGGGQQREIAVYN